MKRSVKLLVSSLVLSMALVQTTVIYHAKAAELSGAPSVTINKALPNKDFRLQECNGPGTVDPPPVGVDD